jgi:hypothetical protein
MDRITPLDRDDAHPDAWPIFDQDEKYFGLVLNPTRILAYRPPILTAARALGRSVATNAVLPAALRALVCVRVATLVGCPF